MQVSSLWLQIQLVFLVCISQIKMASATIIEPTGESDTALKFTAGLLLGIPLDAEINNLEDTSHVRIMVSRKLDFILVFSLKLWRMMSFQCIFQINYPDQQVHLICPRASDFRPDSSGNVRLLTTVLISHQVCLFLILIYKHRKLLRWKYLLCRE